MRLLCSAAALPVLSIFLLTGCGKTNQFVPPPPPKVAVQAPRIGEATVYTEFSGRTEASARVEIRARVKGFLKSSEFQAGQYVEKGQTLFTIEPEQFEAALRTAQGQLEKAKADLEIATANFKRRKQASSSGAVSELDVLSAEADQKAAAAAVNMAEAAVADAERDLSYTKILAPISGRISDARVDQGNLVGADPTLLTEIVSTKPLYANIEFSEREALPFLANLPNEENPTGAPAEKGGARSFELSLVLSDGSIHDEIGYFDFVDNRVSPETGTIRARAIFPNEKEVLTDGLFGKVRVPRTFPNAVQVPSAVIQRDIGGSFVLLANEENQVVRRSVIPTEFSLGDQKLIEPFDEESGTGVRANDRIIVSNLQRAREGIVIEPVDPGPPSEEPAVAPSKPEPKSDAEEEEPQSPAEAAE